MGADLRAVHIKDKVRFAKAMIAFFGQGGLLSLEGHLSHLREELEAIPGMAWEETAELRRNTLVPRLDFAILPLRPETTERVLRRIVPHVGIVRRVIHLQIAMGGTVQFGAYDNFHPDCTMVGPAVSDAFLEGLVEQGILHDFKPTAPAT
jgi:hypothetical protein